MDFVGDSRYSGRSYRLCNALDEVNRETLVLEVDFSLPSTRVVAVLYQLVPWHGWPLTFRMYYGLEFIADAVRTWF